MPEEKKPEESVNEPIWIVRVLTLYRQIKESRSGK